MPLIVVVVAAVVVIAIVWAFLGRRSKAPAPVSPPPSALTAAEAISKLCDDIPIDQNFRVDALNRDAQQVRTDAEAIRNAGDKATAHKAVAVAVAMENFAKTLGTQGDTTADNAALQAAIDKVKPSC